MEELKSEIRPFNKLEIIDRKGNTQIKINGQEIHSVSSYRLDRVGSKTFFTFKISIDNNISSIDIDRPLDTLEHQGFNLDM